MTKAVPRRGIVAGPWRERWEWTAALMLAMLCGLGALPAPVAAAPPVHACAEADATVVARRAADAAVACVAAEQAVRFMSAHGFTTDFHIEICVVEDSSELDDGPPAFGCFDARSARVKVLSLTGCQALLGGKPMFRLPLNDELYRSVIVHEVAHAIAARNFPIRHPSHVAHEYIAYTVQLATMSEALRRRILERIDNEAFGADGEISELFLALGPEIFAVKAYRHFLRPGHGAAFYRRVLSGDFRPSSDD